MREPLFPDGTVVRVKDPAVFITSFATRIAQRDAIVKSNLQDLTNDGKAFKGRLLVEFQKRNGRGKVFTEVMNERDFVAAARGVEIDQREHA